MSLQNNRSMKMQNIDKWLISILYCTLSWNFNFLRAAKNRKLNISILTRQSAPHMGITSHRTPLEWLNEKMKCISYIPNLSISKSSNVLVPNVLVPKMSTNRGYKSSIKVWGKINEKNIKHIFVDIRGINRLE